jgi:hypothetical protein
MVASIIRVQSPLTFKNTHVNYNYLKTECSGKNFDLGIMMEVSNLGYKKLYY